jgi:NAD+ kinase
MKHFGVFIHPSYINKEKLQQLVANLRQEYQLTFFGFTQQKNILDPSHFTILNESEPMPQLDCILVFGGDGTILRAKDIALKTKAPILGINIGYLGFLSESTLADLHKSLRELLDNKYRVQERMLLTVQLKRQGQILYKGLALNDAVIYKGESARLINVRIYNNGRFVLDTRCDGVIASTPTGSTAYSLSAGGPILSPVMQAIVVSPLNPHILSIRPMVFPADDKLSFRLHGIHTSGWIQIDGVNAHMLVDNDELLVTASKKHVKFIKLSNRTFYQILRNKMHLGK